MNRIALCVGVLAAGLVASPSHAAPAYAAVPLGTLGGTNGYTNAINNAGSMAGLACTPGNAECHAVIYADGQVKDLGPAGVKLSNAYDINDSWPSVRIRAGERRETRVPVCEWRLDGHRHVGRQRR